MQFGKIQASIGRQWFPKFMADVREGHAYILENLMVGRNDKMFPKTEHKFKLNFMGITKLTPTVVDQIPPHVFDFLDFPNIIGTKKTDIFIGIVDHQLYYLLYTFIYGFIVTHVFLFSNKVCMYVDVIGHVVEKSKMTEKEIRGKKSDLLDLVFEDLA